LYFDFTVQFSPLSIQLQFSIYSRLTYEPGSSVSIVSGYGLDDRAIEVRYPAEAKGFFV
jgi:hypothetical protein